MIILGVDQGFGKAAGYGVLSLGDAVKPLLIHTFLEDYKYQPDSANGKIPKLKSIPADDVFWRYRRFFNTSKHLIQTYKPGLIVTELPFHFSGHYDTTLRVISELNGILILLASSLNIPIIRINVASWHSRMLKGVPGKDTKEQSINLIKELFDLELPDHVTDALCLCMAAPLFLEEENRNVALLSQ